MRLSPLVRYGLIFSTLLATIGCDQVSKSIIRHTVDQSERISLLNDHLTVMKVENSGAFLSIGHNLPAMVRLIPLVFLPVLVLVFGIYFIVRRRDVNQATLLGICCVLGGGIGNIYDRVMYGSVTDFLHIDFGLFETGVFNLADVSIMIGVLVVLFNSYAKRTLNENPS